MTGMTAMFKAPSPRDILRDSALSASPRAFNASLEYEAGGEKYLEAITLTVPSGAHIGQIKQAMSDAVRERIESRGANYGFLRFRLDGAVGKLTAWQWVQDLWFRITWRGKPHTGSHFVPIWPAPRAL